MTLRSFLTAFVVLVVALASVPSNSWAQDIGPYHNSKDAIQASMPVSLTTNGSPSSLLKRFAPKTAQACTPEGEVCTNNPNCCFPTACLCINQKCAYQVCHR
jgi:hypothetical protein